MIEYLLDSDVLIWQLRDQRETVELLAKLSKRGILACSVVSIVEIQAGARRGELAVPLSVCGDRDATVAHQ